ncbi:MAG: potassium/proton antiporter [Prevotellaceae bacterium]|jgi:cell volume regulation protein A|nr:potassium/proton antiporter [Prevotellaceae bacterium]
MEITAENILWLGSILLFLSILTTRAGHRFGVPALLLFLGVGMLVGSDGLGIVFSNQRDAQFIGMIALIIILFSGGMDTKYSDIKPVATQGVVLATFGVLLTALFTGLFIYLVTGFLPEGYRFNLLESFLLASVMSSTDSASVFSILRNNGVTLKQNMRPLLELESGSNDPMAYMLTIVLIQAITTQSSNWAQMVGLFFYQLIMGAVCGYLLGKICNRALRRSGLQTEALYPIMILAFAFFTFAITEKINANGYLAVYVGGLVVGNVRYSQTEGIRNFFDGMAWLAQIIIFLTLGLLVNPLELLPIAGIGLMVGVFMILISRPLAVFACLAPFRKMTKAARLFTSWVGLRGAVPIIFATYPLVAEIPKAPIMFNIVFFITIISLVVQGTTIPIVARWLKLGEPVTV